MNIQIWELLLEANVEIGFDQGEYLGHQRKKGADTTG